MTPRYRFRSGTADLPLYIGGQAVMVQEGASLLADLLSAPGVGEQVEFYCAIGQCFRCTCLVDGRVERSCVYYPRGGERVELTSANEPGTLREEMPREERI